MSNKPTRRDVLRATAATVVGAALSPTLLASGGRKASGRMRIACVGVGGRGGAHLKPAAEFGDLVALCDIDTTILSKAVAEYPKAASFVDFRSMLDKMGDSIDAVVVATPDHTHAVAAAMALRMGKHVYCEKPLTHTLYEARTLQALAKRAGTATQMGNQGSATDDLRNAVSIIKGGMFGAVKEVHCWTDRAGGWWPQGVERPASKPAPNTVAWDLWLGPSPDRPYADGYHPFAWRGWWDFGCGALGDIGCHNVNLPFQALDLRDPLSVQAETSPHNKDSYPQWSIVRYEFGARGDRGPITMFWYDSGKRPPVELAHGETLAGNGCIVVCEHATLYSAGEYGGAMHLAGGGALPRSSNFVHSPGHFQEWVESMESGKPTGSDIVGVSGPLTETVLLGNLAVWARGEKLEWDARNLRVKGRPEFDAVIRPAYRPGWTL